MARNLIGLSKSLGQLKRIVPSMAPVLAARFNAYLVRGFESGTNPYGAPFAPLKPSTIRRHNRSPPPLSHTMALKAAAKIILQGLSLRFNGTPPYGDIHMGGSRYMAKRAFYPDAGLPASWQKDIKDLYREQLESMFPGSK